MSGWTTNESFRGLVAIVTGGARGIGRSVAEHLARADGSVVSADLDASGGRLAVEEIAGSLPDECAGSVRFEWVDVRDPESIAELCRLTVERYGRIDILVNKPESDAAPLPTS